MLSGKRRGLEPRAQEGQTRQVELLAFPERLA